MDISSMLEVQVDEVKEIDIKENVTPKDLHPTMPTVLQPITPEECNFYKLAFSNDISTVRFRRIHCTACDAHIGSAPAEAHNMFEHPILRTLLCAKCREFYGDGTFEQGDDATDMFCRWCANGGNLYCCSYCSNTFCYKCIKRNFDYSVRKKIEADEKWKCFVCNPADLYSTRAVCWALLQHIQTVTRLLRSDKTMSPEEVEERMNLDETECCPRRQKRKRRKTGSNSEDEDQTYRPTASDGTIITKRKAVKKKYKYKRRNTAYDEEKCTIRSYRTYRAFTSFVPIKPRPTSPESTSNTSEGSTSLRFVDKTKIDNASTNSGSAFVLPVLKKQQDTLLPSQVNSIVLENVNPPVVQTTLYNSTINAVPTAKLLQSTAAFKSMHGMVNPCIQTKNSSQPTYYPTTQMVTIPNQKPSLTLNTTRSLIPKPRKMVQMMVTPNIIELDSDSDEPTVVQSTNIKHAHNTPSNENNTININSPSTIAVPVALVSTDNACNNNNKIKINEIENQSSREIFASLSKEEKSFSQYVLVPHKEEFENILHNLKGKFNQILLNSQNEEVSKTNIQNAKYKIQNLYREICNTVTQLAYINDRIVRSYSNWEDFHNLSYKVTKTATNKTSTLAENNEIPLDMTCVNDSASDSENEDKLLTLVPSEFVASTNIFETFSKKKDMKSRGVGDSSILCKDKSVQVNSVESSDYDQVIGYSKLIKSDHSSLTENSIVDHVTVSSKCLDKYQEQFIFHLQHIEDHGIEIDDTSSSDVLENLKKIEVDSCTTETISKEPSSTIFDNCSKSSENLAEKCILQNENNVEDTELPSPISESETVSNIARIAETSTSNDNVDNQVEQKHAKLTSNTQSDQQDLNIKEETLVEKNSLISDEGNSKDNICSVATEDECTIIEN